MIRIAMLGDFGLYFSYYLHGVMQGAILNNAWFRPIEISRSLEDIKNRMLSFRPHILFTHAIFKSKYHSLEDLFDLLNFLKKEIKVKIVCHAGDPKKPRYQGNISSFFDLGLVNSNQCRQFSDIWKISCIHWPFFCFCQKRVFEINKQYLNMVVFTGNVSEGRKKDHPHYGRYEFIGELNKKIPVKIYPDKSYPDTRFLTPEIAISANAILGIQLNTEIEGYLDTRPFQYIGAGALYFHDKCENIDQFFEDGKHYLSYEKGNVDSFVEKYNYYVNKYPEKGNEIRINGFKFCQKYYNSKIRVKQVIDFFENKGHIYV